MNSVQPCNFGQTPELCRKFDQSWWLPVSSTNHSSPLRKCQTCVSQWSDSMFYYSLPFWVSLVRLVKTLRRECAFILPPVAFLFLMNYTKEYLSFPIFFWFHNFIAKNVQKHSNIHRGFLEKLPWKQSILGHNNLKNSPRHSHTRPLRKKM